MRLVREQIEPLVELLKGSFEDGGHGDLDEDKVRRSIDREMDNPKSLVLVNKAVTAVLVIMVTPSHFAVKPDLQVTEFYSQTAGSGFRLLKEAQPWIDRWGDAVNNRVIFSTGTDKTNSMLERFGMKQIGVLMEMRGEG